MERTQKGQGISPVSFVTLWCFGSLCFQTFETVERRTGRVRTRRRSQAFLLFLAHPVADSGRGRRRFDPTRPKSSHFNVDSFANNRLALPPVADLHSKILDARPLSV